MNHLFREYRVTREVWRALSFQNILMNQCKVSNGTEVANFINNYINEINGLEKRDRNRTGENQRWSYPQESFININFDGAYDKSQNRSASGIVARDSERNILFSCSEIHSNISSAFAAEAIACWRAVQIGTGKGWQFLILEGDSLAIIKNAIQRVKTDRW
ncbi:hypothetical protein GOBAR_DD03702 [Gossypium barbadense]|nr:hypothetical protein GOBAR_DD03702 [Gossypium barbadense]